MTIHPKDYDQLVCEEPVWFDVAALEQEHGGWSRHCVRNSLVLELLAQLCQEGVKVLFKGGSLLQTRLSWPPNRASIDLDVESTDAMEVQEALESIMDRFKHSNAEVIDLDTRLPGKQLQVTLRHPSPQAPTGSTTRVDVVESHGWSGYQEVFEFPRPWNACRPVDAPSQEAQAAQKALLAADPPYGREVESSDLRRKSRIKDLYDLYCLGQVDLDGYKIVQSAHFELAHEKKISGQTYSLPEIISGAKQNLVGYLAPRPTNRQHPVVSFWRAYRAVEPTIREPFPQEQLRIVAGCVWHVLHGVQIGQLDWDDVWKPLGRQPRRVWKGADAIVPIAEPIQGFEEIAGLREAWADPDGP